MREIRRHLSWVEFLAPLSEGKMTALLWDARFVLAVWHRSVGSVSPDALAIRVRRVL